MRLVQAVLVMLTDEIRSSSLSAHWMALVMAGAWHASHIFQAAPTQFIAVGLLDLYDTLSGFSCLELQQYGLDSDDLERCRGRLRRATVSYLHQLLSLGYSSCC